MSAVLVTISILLLSCFAQKNYFVDKHTNCNNIYGTISDPDTSNQWVTLLGIFENTDDCINAWVKFNHN